MFTPPPSPPASDVRFLSFSAMMDEKLRELQISEEEDHEAEDSSDHPLRSSPTARSYPAIMNPRPVSQARRRIIIPLVAVLLVLVAISVRYAAVGGSFPFFDVSVGSLSGSAKGFFLRGTPDPTPTLPQHEVPYDHLGDTFHAGSHSERKHAPRQATTSSQPSSSAAADVVPSIPNPPFPVPTPFPQPYDTSFSTNFSTQTCQSFFATGFLTNTTFRSCRAFSLLFPSSQEFSKAQKNFTELTAIIGGTCATTPSVDTCVGTMDWLAQEMQKDTMCGKDIKDNNAVVMKAWSGFKNYKLMREAGCLINQRTNTYCFVNAVAASSPSDVYFYNLPLGVRLPNKTVPSCSSCVQSLLSLYAVHATNTSKAISSTYPDAAAKAAQQCGNSYAKLVSSSGAAGGGILVDLTVLKMLVLVSVSLLAGISTLVTI